MIDPFTGPQRNMIQTDVGYEFSRGRVANSREHHIWGSNFDVDAALEDFGAVVSVPLLTSASAMEIISSSVADASAGTGAQTVRLIGLNANWNVQREILTLNGTTAVISALTWLRITDAIVETVGSGGGPAGILSIRESVAGATHRQIRIGTLRADQCHYTVPAGKEALIVDWGFSANFSGLGNSVQAFLSATIRPDVRPVINSTGDLWLPQASLSASQSSMACIPKAGFLLPAKRDIKVEGLQTIGSGTVGVGAWITVLEYDIITD